MKLNRVQLQANVQSDVNGNYKWESRQGSSCDPPHTCKLQQSRLWTSMLWLHKTLQDKAPHIFRASCQHQLHNDKLMQQKHTMLKLHTKGFMDQTAKTLTKCLLKHVSLWTDHHVETACYGTKRLHNSKCPASHSVPSRKIQFFQ